LSGGISVFGNFGPDLARGTAAFLGAKIAFSIIRPQKRAFISRPNNNY
jgi:hypothetical protein